MKAILLHHAGGDKYVFRNLQQALLPEIESIAYELPGRSDRFSERFVASLEDAVNDIYSQLIKEQIQDFFVVGNSMGALLAFLLAHKLKQENKPLPKHLFLASRLSPDAYKNEPNIIGITSDDFWKVVQQYDGVPKDLLGHKENIDVSASILFGNKDTRNVDEAKMQGWRKFFTSAIEINSFEGGHFFLYENEEVPKYIKSKVFITQKQ